MHSDGNGGKDRLGRGAERVWALVTAYSSSASIRLSSSVTAAERPCRQAGSEKHAKKAMGGVHLVATEQGLDPHGSLVPHVDLPLKVSHVVLCLPC